MNHRVILLDIEGTTTPITFVRDTLFPYTVQHVQTYLHMTWNTDNTQSDIHALKEYILHNSQLLNDTELNTDCLHDSNWNAYSADKAALLVYVVKILVQNDVKCTALKQLQGHMWHDGYVNNAYTGAMYSDVLPAFKRWKQQQKHIFIYSSGSVNAQKLIFHYSEAGDLLPCISGHYDTVIGHKQDKNSYQRIYESIRNEHQLPLESSHDILFCTDIYNEAVAAVAAGMDVVCMLRTGNAPLPADNQFKTAHNFDHVN